MSGRQANVDWLAAQVADGLATRLGYQPGFDTRPSRAVLPSRIRAAGTAGHDRTALCQ